MTKADLIRSASDYELAFLITGIKVRAIEKVYESFGITDKICGKTKERLTLEMLDWLKQEASNA